MSDIESVHDEAYRYTQAAMRAVRECVVCEANPMSFQWSDYHGEAMCIRCGTPYQLRAGSEEMIAEDNYPYCNLSDEWISVVREYFSDTKRFTYLGMSLGGLRPGLSLFYEWAKPNHPELWTESTESP